MDIVRRAYLETLKEIEPDTDSATYFHERMRQNMVRWIELKAYSRSDWPKEMGAYPVKLAQEIRLSGKLQ
jgi:hypothetical protein